MSLEPKCADASGRGPVQAKLGSNRQLTKLPKHDRRRAAFLHAGGKKAPNRLVRLAAASSTCAVPTVPAIIRSQTIVSGRSQVGAHRHADYHKLGEGRSETWA